MPLFNLPQRATRADDKRVVNKARTAVKSTTSVRGGGLLAQIAQINAAVEKNLGQFKDEYQVINDKELLHDYITDCIGNSYISIDTETSGFDPLQDSLVGICISTRNNKGSYIPLNHVSYVTGVKADGQLDMLFVMDEFKRLLAKKPDIDMFNAKFDIRFLRANGLADIYATWDGYLASMLLNENEPSHGLKALHKKYVLDDREDAFSFDALFHGISFDKVPIQTAYLYAAHDPVITTELCDFQRIYLREDSDREDMRNIYWVFKNIEMPCISVVADMEDTGVKFDLEYQQELSVKYNQLMIDKEKAFYEACKPYAEAIEAYRRANVNCKFDNPINIGSPSQIAILLYDILKIESPDAKSPRGTGEAILQKIGNPITKAILEYREMSKLVSTYIDKLPACVNPKDGRIHCSFNQYGAATGRFSSSDPNLQNIPSHNKDIRKMFVATNEEKLVSTDTQQFVVDRWCEVECTDEWKYADKIIVGDELLLDDGSCVNVCEVNVNQDTVIIDFT